MYVIIPCIISFPPSWIWQKTFFFFFPWVPSDNFSRILSCSLFFLTNVGHEFSRKLKCIPAYIFIFCWQFLYCRVLPVILEKLMTWRSWWILLKKTLNMLTCMMSEYFYLWIITACSFTSLIVSEAYLYASISVFGGILMMVL